LFTTAQTELSSSLTGMLNSLVPLFTVIIGMLFFRMPFRILKVVGVMVGLIGALGLIGGQFQMQRTDLFYALLVVLATISYATNVNFIKRFLKEVSAVNITAFGFLIPGPIMLIYLLNTDFIQRLENDPSAYTNLFYIAILGIVGTSM